MSVRMYRVGYGFMAGPLCTLVYTSAALINLHSASKQKPWQKSDNLLVICRNIMAQTHKLLS